MRSTTPPSTVLRTVLAAAALTAAAGVLSATTAALELPQATTLTPAAYLVTVTNPGPGAGTITSDPAGLSCDTSCHGWLPTGSTLTLTATAGAGSEFLRWFGDCEGTGLCTLTVDGPKMAVGSFKLTGDPFTVLRQFMPGPHDGAGPTYTHLVSDGAFLYGMTANGGRADGGTVFRVRLDGTELEVLHEFVGGPADGLDPWGSLTLVGGTLFGMTRVGGPGGLGVVFKVATDGRSFEIVHAFSSAPADGALPYGSLVVHDGALFGMTRQGGATGMGCVFKLGLDGSGFQLLHSFGGGSGAGFYPTGSLTVVGEVLFGMTRYGGSHSGGSIFSLKPDGSEFQTAFSFDWRSPIDAYEPFGSLIESGGVLFGLTSNGSSSRDGTLFRVGTDGTGFHVLKSFSGSSGTTPYGSVVLLDGVLFGLTSTDGDSRGGTAFRIAPDGSGFTVMHAFGDGVGDGKEPYGSFAAVGGALYGLTRSGGSGGTGTLFKILPDGSGYQVLRSFSPPGPQGGRSRGDLVVDGDVLYGTSERGGSFGSGTVFRVNADGSAYQVLHSFAGAPEDGASPYAGLALVGGTLYGTTVFGGPADLGTAFRVNTDGTGYQLLHSFGIDVSDGWKPYSSLVHDNGVLYGAAVSGGPQECGTVFRLNTDGSGYQLVADPCHIGVESPRGSLLLHNGWLYGTAVGHPWYGTIFKVRTDGASHRVLHYFGATTGDGRYPYGALALAGDVLYGTTREGGSDNYGVVFSIRTDGSEYDLLHEFAGYPTDGSNPVGSLWVDGDVLFGHTSAGGAAGGGGCLFRLNADGSEYQVMRSLGTTRSEGSSPYTTPLLREGLILGLTSSSGAGGNGTLYSLRKEVAVGGSVSADGSPLPGVTLFGLPGSPVSGADGQYSAGVPLRWSGTVTPVLAGRLFTPPSRVLADVQHDQTGQDFTASTCAVLSLSPEVFPTAWLGTPFSQQLSVQGGPGPFTFSLVSGSLPAGLALDGSTGLISGTPTSAGSVEISVLAVDGTGCSTFRAYSLVISSYLLPIALRTDEVASGGTSSDLNGVLEEGETVTVSPSWHNGSTTPRSITSVGARATGPAEGGYAFSDASAAYGSIPPGATVGASEATGDAFAFYAIGDPWTGRPAPHWDARFTETLNDGTTKTWTLHIGDSFADVARSHWAYRFIETIFHNRVTSGCNAAPFNYCPGTTLTRAEMAVLVLMAKHGPDYVPPLSSGTVFSDVPIDHWAGDFIEQLAAEGITSGCGTGVYCPTAPITRAEMAVFLLMAEHGAGYVPPLSSGTVFTDVPIDHWAGDFIEQLAAEGITGGCATGLYCPTGIVTRAEMAVFLTATFDLQLND